MKEIIRKEKLTDKEAAEYRQALIEEGMVCANCGKELERPHQVHNCMVPHAQFEIQRNNYLKLVEAVMGSGTTTAEFHDIFAIAKRHREAFYRREVK